MEYQMDTSAARKADSRSSFISEIGAYTGKFTRVEAIQASTGTAGIGFTFVSDTGQRTDFSLYTTKADGTQLFGYQTLSAILACLSLRGITSAPGKVLKFDRELGREVEMQSTVFPQMLGKPIGVMLETREYEKRDGSIGMSMELAAVFQADTHFMASEILDRAPKAEKFEKAFAGLKHRPLKRGTAPAARAASAAYSDGAGGAGDLDDDIPF
jgi:hypothetical protein